MVGAQLQTKTTFQNVVLESPSLTGLNRRPHPTMDALPTELKRLFIYHKI